MAKRLIPLISIFNLLDRLLYFDTMHCGLFKTIETWIAAWLEVRFFCHFGAVYL